MLLTTTDRILFPAILPQQFTRMQKIALDQIVKKYEFSEEEVLRCGVKLNGVNWSWESPCDKEVEFSEFENDVIVNHIKTFDDSKLYSKEESSLIEKFIPDFFV